MTDQAKRTPGPWSTDADDLGVWINCAAPEPIAKMGKSTNHNARANAAFIVEACNSHDALLSQLNEAVGALEKIAEYGGEHRPIRAAEGPNLSPWQELALNPQITVEIAKEALAAIKTKGEVRP